MQIAKKNITQLQPESELIRVKARQLLFRVRMKYGRRN